MWRQPRSPQDWSIASEDRRTLGWERQRSVSYLPHFLSYFTFYNYRIYRLLIDLLLVAGVEPGVDSVLKIGGSGNHHLFLLLGKHLAEAATEGRHVSFRVARVTDYLVAIVAIVRDAKRDLIVL